MVTQIRWDTLCECGDCDWGGPLYDLGETTDQTFAPRRDGVPAGWCPNCDGLAYIRDNDVLAVRNAMELAALFRERPDVIGPAVARLNVDALTMARSLGFDYRTAPLTEGQALLLAGYAKSFYRSFRE